MTQTIIYSDRFSKPVNFLPGVDEWFTYNIYSGLNLLDTVLSKIYDGIVQLFNQGTIRAFFYVRYRDPHPHLRLRFRLTAPDELGNVIGSLRRVLEPYFREDVIWNTTITGYQREIQRYGTLTIESIEEIFSMSSMVTMENLAKCHLRWDLALIYINVIFDLLDYTTDQRAVFCRLSKESFFNEFIFDKSSKLALKNKFSAYYHKFNSLMSDRESEIYLSYKNKLSDSFERFRGLMNFYPNSALDPVVSSIVHMEFNRVFLSKGREKEAIMFYFLDRYYARQLNEKHD